MAQDTTPAPPPDAPAASEERRPGFHYYSGGEIKELEHTNVSPLLWAGWTVVILGAVLYLFFGGALGPNGPFGGFHPTGGSAKVQKDIQVDLTKQMYGNETAQQADMRYLKPFLGSESLNSAVSDSGPKIYQSYCIGCHGPNQDGNGVNAASLNPKPRNLHDGPFMRETLDYKRINRSLHYGVHGTAMPRWENTLTEPEIQEVIAYVLSLTWTMPPSSDMDTTTGQLGTPPPTPPGMTQSDATVGQGGPGKSPGGSVQDTPGGSSVQGGSVSTSPEPITPPIGGNPAADTSTSPPSQSGQSAPGNPNTGNVNTPDSVDQPGGPKTPPAAGTR